MYCEVVRFGTSRVQYKNQTAHLRTPKIAVIAMWKLGSCVCWAHSLFSVVNNWQPGCVFLAGESLYDWSGMQFDDQTLQVLHHQQVALAHMVTIFQAIANQAVPTTEQGKRDALTVLVGVDLCWEGWYQGNCRWKKNGSSGSLFLCREERPGNEAEGGDPSVAALTSGLVVSLQGILARVPR